MQQQQNTLLNSLLVIGGGGFIGRHVVREAVKRGFQVSVLSLNLPSSDHMLENVNYFSADIRSLDSISNVLGTKYFHYVINFGGYINHSNFSDSGDDVINVHFGGVLNLVRCLDRSSLKRFIQVGSSDEYGNNQAPQDELHRESPISPYSFAKVAATQFMQMLYRTEDFPAVCLRPFLVYGPEQGRDRFIPQVIEGCLKGNHFPVSEGRQLRDFCYVHDIANAIFSSLESDNAIGEVINIAAGTPVSIRYVVETIRDIVGMGDPEFGVIPYRKNENMKLYADISKAKDILNWKPVILLESGLKKTIQYYSSEKL